MSLLAADMRIGADQLIGILEKHHVSGNVNTLQRGYRRRIAISKLPVPPPTSTTV
jgi:hypothetical protein